MITTIFIIYQKEKYILLTVAVGSPESSVAILRPFSNVDTRVSGTFNNVCS